LKENFKISIAFYNLFYPNKNWCLQEKLVLQEKLEQS